MVFDTNILRLDTIDKDFWRKCQNVTKTIKEEKKSKGEGVYTTIILIIN